MPTWGEELQELAALDQAAKQTPTQVGGPSPHDILRRKYLKRLHEKTGRAVIVYATAWLETKEAPPGALQVSLGDKAGFMEAVSSVEERELDLFLHSPGGSPEAAEAIMDYLRTRFDHIRAVVPIAAMSAATMMALAADEVLMGAHSQLGPIDPQLTISTPEGPRSAPGQAIKDQFAKAKAECQDSANIAAWLPILRSYGPGLLSICDDAQALSVTYVTKVLEAHMFAGESDAADKAKAAAEWFADYTAFRSHGRQVSRDEARGQGIKVTDLEADDELQDAVLSVHHAVSHTLAGTDATKIIENHHGRAWIQQHRVVQMIGPPPGAPPPPGLGHGAPPPATLPVRGGNRAERRRKGRS